MEIDKNMQTFISEDEELLQEMEESLLALEESGKPASKCLTSDLLVENQMVQKEVVEEALNKQSKVWEQKQKALTFVKVDSLKQKSRPIHDNRVIH